MEWFFLRAIAFYVSFANFIFSSSNYLMNFAKYTI